MCERHNLTVSELVDRLRLLDSGSSRDHKQINYGTSGFRGRVEDIEHIFVKVGIAGGLRCLSKINSTVGTMITASHNPIQDNGVKLIDANGEMLDSTWEPIVERLCQLQGNHLNDEILSIVEGRRMLDRDPSRDDSKDYVLIGYDTRPSSERLANLVKQGLDVLHPLVRYRDYGLVTTPALHWLVGEHNRRGCQLEVDDYYKMMIAGLAKSFSVPRDSKNYNSTNLVVDNAFGVGSITMKYLCKDETFNRYLPVKLINCHDEDGILNHECGADFVKTKLCPPKAATEVHKRYASLDGDADRVVYFYLENEQPLENASALRLHLLDGDKILALYAHFLRGIIYQYELHDKLKFGIVQTAYSNGASTDYLRDSLGLHADCVDTGVKHLHARVKEYDVGVYFEANGHGTIWISDKARSIIENQKIPELSQLLAILNNYTGDAISDILIVEMILRHYDWDIKDWDKLYVDRPNCLTKVEVDDKSEVQTEDAGRTCVSPLGLQAEIDIMVSKFGPGSRCFVRPSGTENIVRIYAESREQESADELANLVGCKVIEFCCKH